MSSSLTASALQDGLIVGIGRCWRRMPEIPVRIRVDPLTNSPVAQWRRQLSYKERIGGSIPSRTTSATRCPGTPTAERLGLNPSVCRFESCSGYSWKTTWLRQLADQLGLEPGMLWVRLPPEPLVTTDYVLVEQLGVLACLSRRRSWVQIPSGTLKWRGTQTGKAAKLKPS